MTLTLQLLKSSAATRKSMTLVRNISRSFVAYALPATLLVILLSGCAARNPRPPSCDRKLTPDLAQPFPPPGWFRQTLECVLDPTSDPSCERLLDELMKGVPEAEPSR